MSRWSFYITLLAPAIVVLLSIPLILQRVPRNWWYGFRTAYAMSSEPVWYRANRISGIALMGAGLTWLVAALVLPNVMVSREFARWCVFLFGLSCLALAVLISFLLVTRGRS